MISNSDPKAQQACKYGMRYREIVEATRKPQEPLSPAEGRKARAKELGLQRRIQATQNATAKKVQDLRNRLAQE
jgi:hypothetical protein